MEQFAYVAGFVVESAWGILPVFVLSVSLGVLVRALRLDGAVRRAFASRVGLSNCSPQRSGRSARSARAP